MAQSRQYIEFEGLFSPSVLGIFDVIRGYADLRDLAAVSVPYKMEEGEQGFRVAGHQRAESEKHAEEIKRYLEHSENRFLPEVILSVRVLLNRGLASGVSRSYNLSPGETVLGAQSPDGALVEISRKLKNPKYGIQRVRIRRRNLERIRHEKVIRRIDGNHRLHLASGLTEDPIVPTKYVAPYCMVLLGPPNDDADDFAESMIFHTINSTALPLESEHGLRLLLGQDASHAMTAEKEFDYSPALHLTRLLADQLQRLPEALRRRFGEQPLTMLWNSARNLIAMDATVARDRQILKDYAEKLIAALVEIVTRLSVGHPSFCQTPVFLELATRVWREAEETDHDRRVQRSVDYLDRIGSWLGSQGIINLLDPLSPAEQLLETYKASRLLVPKRVFLARWYPDSDSPDDAQHKAELRLEQIRQTLANIDQQHDIQLELIDLGTEKGGTFPIHKRMYEAIASSDIVLCDLTGHRPNVYVEAGFALSHLESKRLVFLFEPNDGTDKVPFDLNTFRYVCVSQAAEIPNKLKPEIEAILRAFGANLVE